MPSLTPRLDKLDKNYIINGNFDFWQRSTSATITGGYSTVDRFTTNHTGGSGTASRSTDVPDANSQYSISLAITSATIPEIRHKIESFFSRDLASKTVTFKVKYKVTDSTMIPLKVVFASANAVDNFASITEIATHTINNAPLAASGWQSYTVSLAIPSGASNGLQIRLVRDNGASAATTTTLFSQVQLSLGTLPDLNFSYAGRDIIEELSLCQRYYEKSYDVGISPTSITTSGQLESRSSSATGSANAWLTIAYKNRKRASPTVVIYSPATGINGFLRDIDGGADIVAVPSGGGEGGANITNGGGLGGTFRRFSAHFTADAEL